jgi:hypothetical protein
VVLGQDLQAVILPGSKTYIAVDIWVGHAECPRKNDHNLLIFAVKINQSHKIAVFTV